MFRLPQPTSRHLTAAIAFAVVVAAAFSLSLLTTVASANAPARSATAGTSAKTTTGSVTPAKGKAAKSKNSFEDQPLSPKVTAPAANKSAAKKKSSGGGLAVLRTIMGLVLVLGTIYGIHWLLKRYGEGKKGVLARGASGAIEVLATTPLTPTRALHLVRVGPDILLIGATDSGVTRLGEIDAQHLAMTAANNGDAEFHQALTGAISGQSTVTSMSSGTDKTNDTFMKRFVANLQMMTAR